MMMMVMMMMMSIFSVFKQRINTVDRRLTVSGLTPSTLYHASVVANGSSGTSWPSTPVTFMTYPLSNSGTQ